MGLLFFFLINNQFGKKICINDKLQTFTFKTDDISSGSVAELIWILWVIWIDSQGREIVQGMNSTNVHHLLCDLDRHPCLCRVWTAFVADWVGSVAASQHWWNILRRKLWPNSALNVNPWQINSNLNDKIVVSICTVASCGWLGSTWTWD